MTRNNMIFSVLLGAIAAGGFASEKDGIFRLTLGEFEVCLLVERQNPGNPGILVGADQALLGRYIPAEGFTHSTNAFLIKAPGRNILVDTGFGQTIFEKMKTLGVEPDQIDAVLLTHTHGDHIGGLEKNGQALFPKAKIYLSSLEKAYFAQTPSQRVLTPYGSRVVSFDPARPGTSLRELIPGIFPLASYGHTPGHTAYLVESAGAKLIIAGDFLHVALVQFPHPEISASYDTDKNQAALSRQELLEYAAGNRIPLGGMHMAYPALGTVAAEGRGFVFTQAR